MKNEWTDIYMMTKHRKKRQLKWANNTKKKNQYRSAKDKKKEETSERPL